MNPSSPRPELASGLAELATLQSAAAVTFASEARLLCGLAELTTRDGWRSSAPFESLLMEVAGTCVIGQNSAHTRITDAEHLVTRLRQTLRRLEAGTLGVPQARVLIGETRDLDEVTCAQVEERVLPDAAELPPGALRARVRRVVLTLDAAAAARRAAKARGDRRVWVKQAQEHGMSLLMALVPSEQVSAVMLSLTEQARAMKAAHDDGRSADQLRADLLVELLTGERVAPTRPCRPTADPEPPWVVAAAAADADVDVDADVHADVAADADVPADPDAPADADVAAPAIQLAPPTRPTDPAPPPGQPPPGRVVVVRPLQVVLHVPLATALGVSDEPGEIDGGELVCAARVRELMVTAELRALFVDGETGKPITTRRTPLHRAAPGSAPLTPDELRELLRSLVMTPVPVPPDEPEPRHDPSAELARFVRLRDRQCDGPGCSVPASQCELDHHEAYPAGSTSRANLRARSQRCHHAKHHGWTVICAADGTTRWTGPSTRTYRVHPRWHAPPGVSPDARLLPPAALAAWDRHLLSTRAGPPERDRPTGEGP